MQYIIYGVHVESAQNKKEIDSFLYYHRVNIYMYTKKW